MAEDAGKMVELTGIGFFDRLHGETGQAPNGIELHPTGTRPAAIFAGW
jgi:hypothetical protein